MALYERLPDSNPSPKVGALRLCLLTLDRLSAWDQAIGLIPQDLARVNEQLNVVRFVEAVFDSLKANGVSSEIQEKVVEDLATSDGRW